MATTLFLPNKKIWRASAIKEYLRSLNQNKVVCFSCGNASEALKQVGLDVLAIGDYAGADLIPARWFSQAEIKTLFPDRFDATSGHLSVEVMRVVSIWFNTYLRTVIEEDDEYIIPTGSGETIVCLKLAFPNKRFIARYNYSGLEKETEYHKEAPLNKLVEIVAEKVIIN